MAGRAAHIAGLGASLAAVITVAGCGRIAFDPLVGPIGDAADAPDVGDGAPIDAAPCAGPFQAARNLTELNTSSSENGGSLSNDQLEIYFGSDRPGGAGLSDLYRAARATPQGPFMAPVRIAVLGTAAAEDDPYLEADGLTLWFNRGSALMRSTRPGRDAAWTPAVGVPELETAMDDVAPSFTSDGLTIYFSSDRAPTVGGTPFLDVWRATRPSLTGTFGPAVQEMVASSNSFDCCPHVLAGDMQVMFTSQRSGLAQILVADRAVDGSLGLATVFALVDSPDPFVDFDGFATPDGTSIGVSSDRPGGAGGPDLWLYERSCP